MKTRFKFTARPVTGSVALIICAMSVSHVAAADFLWDGGTVDIAANGDGASDGGTGNWSTSLANWDIGASPHVAWPASGTENHAIFGGAAGTVTLQSDITANGITFNTTGYTITRAGTNVLTLNGAIANLTAGTGISATISSPIAGDSDTVINKAGDGTLILSGANTYTGETTISAGILRIGNASALGTQTGALDGTTISSGATLDLGGVASGAGVERITASGSGVGGMGAITSSSAIATPFIGVRYLTLAGETTLGFTSRWDVGHNTNSENALVGGGHTLNLIGSAAASTSFNNLGDTDLGNINIDFGTGSSAIVYLQGDTTLGRAANTVSISGGATLALWTSSTVASHDKKFALDNGKITVARTGITELLGTIELTNSNTITTNAAAVAITASNDISGSGGLIKAGAGSLTLSGTNSYAGGTTVSAGLLSFMSTSAKPATGTTTVSSTGTLVLGVGGTGTFTSASVDALFANTLENVSLDPGSSIGLDTSAGDFSHSGTSTAARSFTKFGANTLTLQTANLYTGATTISGGTLKLTGGNDSLSTSAAITIAGGATLDLGGNSQTTSGSFTFTSGSTLQNGTLTANTTGSFNNLTTTLNAGADGNFITNARLLAGNGAARTVTLNSTSSGSFTFGGNDGGSMNYIGVGTSGNGTLNINGGTVNFTNAGGGNGYLQVGSNNNTARGAVIVDGGDMNVGTVMKLGGNYLTATGTNATSSLAITDGTVTIGGGNAAGTATTTGLNGVLYLNGHAGSTGGTTGTTTVSLNSGGILNVKQIQAGNGAIKTINFNGGALRAGASSTSFLNAATGLTVNVNMGGATIDTQAFNTTISAALVAGTTAGGGLTKQGGGTLTLAGVNTYTGATLISGGTLALAAGGSIDGSSGVSLGTAGNFDVSAKSGYAVETLTGSGNVIGALTVTTELAIGNSTGTVGFGDLTLDDGAAFNFEMIGGTTGPGSADLGNVSGILTIGSGVFLSLSQFGSGTYTVDDKFTLFSYDSLSGTFDGLAQGDVFTGAGGLWQIDYFDTEAGSNGGTETSFVTITAIPEPAAALLGSLGLLALLRRRRDHGGC